MAKGFETNQERRRALSAFGKDLARRAKSKCELSHASGVPLVTYEVQPAPSEPEFDRCLLVSEPVATQLAKPSLLRPEEWRHLKDLVWSDIPAVQVMCIRLLRHFANDQSWARGILEEAYLDPEIEAWADEATL